MSSKAVPHLADFKAITGASTKDATAYLKKYRTLEAAMDAYYNNPNTASSGGASTKDRERKLGEVWEQFKDPADPKLITIEGTMEMCGELGVDPESDPVLFCLAADLGSKTTGEWEKAPFVAGWMAMSGNVDSLASMKAQLPTLRQKLKTDPKYFKKVYSHTFDLIKPAGSRILPLDTALDMWTLFIPPALTSSPSALSHIPPGVSSSEPSTLKPEFSEQHFQHWLEFQKNKGKAVSKDTWNLLIDFIRSIDKDFKEYDDSAAWPSTIDDFVEYVRAKQ